MESINQEAFDRFTSAHAGVGITMAVMDIPWPAALAITAAWELIENELKDRQPLLFPYSSHDSRANSLGDSLAVMLAYFVTRHATKGRLSRPGRAALNAAVGSTLGGFAGAALFGAVAKLKGEQAALIERGSSNVASLGPKGYQVGSTLGGAVGAARAVPKEKGRSAFGAAAGGGTLGPLGAALGAYLATRRRA